MPRVSAGLLMYRLRARKLQVLLAHPGGPFFKTKDDGAWTIPKGEIELSENLLEAAKREFEEETGVRPTGPFIALTPVKQKGGKIVHAWAFQGDYDPSATVSNTFSMEWPPGSGRQMEFPEIDRAEFFELAAARRKIKAGQEALIDEIQEISGLIVAVVSALQPENGSVPAAEKAPRHQVLTGDDAKRAEELGRKVDELRATGKYAGAREPAREILAIRTRGLGATHWQTADAKRDLQTLDRLVGAHRSSNPASELRRDPQTASDRKGIGESDNSRDVGRVLAPRNSFTRRNPACDSPV